MEEMVLKIMKQVKVITESITGQIAIKLKLRLWVIPSANIMQDEDIRYIRCSRLICYMISVSMQMPLLTVHGR